MIKRHTADEERNMDWLKPGITAYATDLQSNTGEGAIQTLEVTKVTEREIPSVGTYLAAEGIVIDDPINKEKVPYRFDYDDLSIYQTREEARAALIFEIESDILDLALLLELATSPATGDTQNYYCLGDEPIEQQVTDALALNKGTDKSILRATLKKIFM